MKRKLKILLAITGAIVAPVLLSPLPRFNSPLSTVIESSNGALLGARIAEDGQWRFPAEDYLPDKFEKSLLLYEDQWFYYHPGINPVAILRAFRDNTKAHKIVTGGSTITMQLARLSRGNTKRTYPEKLIEIF